MTTIDQDFKNFGLYKPEYFGIDRSDYLLMRHRYQHRMLTFRVEKISKSSGKVIIHSHILWIGSIVSLLEELEQYEDEEYYLINSEEITVEEFIELNQGKLNTF